MNYLIQAAVLSWGKGHSEVSLLECKREITNKEKRRVAFLVSIISLANSASIQGKDAYFIYGVAENDNQLVIDGLSETPDEATYHQLINVNTKISNDIDFECGYVTNDNGTVLLVTIKPQSKLIFSLVDIHCAKQKNKIRMRKNICYSRNGPSLSELSPDQVFEYYSSSKFPNLIPFLLKYGDSDSCKLNHGESFSIYNYEMPSNLDIGLSFSTMLVGSFSTLTPNSLSNFASSIAFESRYLLFEIGVLNSGKKVANNLQIDLEVNTDNLEIILGNDYNQGVSRSLDVRNEPENTTELSKNGEKYSVKMFISKVRITKEILGNNFIAIRPIKTGEFHFTFTIVCDEFSEPVIQDFKFTCEVIENKISVSKLINMYQEEIDD
ncbi:ATP-binding protein [Marinicella sp. S1101]|uniref:ATP-binding protein n=1 Tax=Marinicella marina TaxID=2996016 RepID=UPI002260DF46|nr:ATP-binding protein [Marinicella marina]MCX7555184.1 ATP-binding protein [Marinicella marina]MDJ1140010.1 ATP-binding protein [Marinicella marina]